MKDRLRVNKLVLEVASWVASAVARRVELWEDTTLVLPPALAAPLVFPPALAARAAVLAFGDVLLDFVHPDDSGLAVAAARRTYLPRQPTCCRAPRPRCARSCSGWPTPPRGRAKARAHPRAVRARPDGPRACRREWGSRYFADLNSFYVTCCRSPSTAPGRPAQQAPKQPRCTPRGLLQALGRRCAAVCAGVLHPTTAPPG